MISSRRSFLTGLASLIAAPAIVRVTSLMPVRGIIMDSGYVGSIGGVSIYEDLVDITRQAFVPRLYVQLYDKWPQADWMSLDSPFK